MFWRRAQDDRAKHLPFLRHCLASDDYASFAVDGEAVVIAKTRGAPPPFAWDDEPTWLVDDFFVERSSLWPTAGRALLERVADEARSAGARRLVVVAARLDEPKRSFLLDAGYETAAFWWVLPLEPSDRAAPEPEGVRTIVGPAPPVYDPGGEVALAVSPVSADVVGALTEWAASRGAVLSIVPARASDPELRQALESARYERASEWFALRL